MRRRADETLRAGQTAAGRRAIGRCAAQPGTVAPGASLLRRALTRALIVASLFTLAGLPAVALADGHLASEQPAASEPAATGEATPTIHPELDDLEPGEGGAEDGDVMANPMYVPWSYNTGYFFGLTRGLKNSGCEGGCYWAVVPFTAILDVCILPGAAIAGLFG